MLVVVVRGEVGEARVWRGMREERMCGWRAGEKVEWVMERGVKIWLWQ
jgi:hypothetical protein